MLDETKNRTSRWKIIYQHRGHRRLIVDFCCETVKAQFFTIYNEFGHVEFVH